MAAIEFDKGIRVSCRGLTRIGYSSNGSRHLLLNRVSADFEPGKLTAIIGPSGCGKTTLLKALCGIEQADSGKVYIGGYDYYAAMEAYGSLISYLPQFDDLHDELTVWSELSYMALLRMPKSCGKDARNDAIRKHLGSFGLSSKAKSRISSLSGGEKKRIAIIGALLSRPRILLLDEPTAPLDPGTSDDFINELRSIATDSGTTIIFVTHDPDALPSTDSVLLLKEGGKVAYSGGFAQLLLALERRFGSRDGALQSLFKAFSAGENLGFLNPGDCGDVRFQREVSAIRIETRGFLRQLAILISREEAVVVRGGVSSMLLLALPFIIGGLVGMVVDGDSAYASYTTTKSMMFSVAAGAFFMGIFDSIHVFAKRDRIKTEQLHGLKTGAYVLAVFVVECILCMVQAAILYSVFVSIVGEPANELYSANFDIYTTAFLCAVSAMALGLLCSSIFKNPTYLAPILVLLQLIFSGIIFQLDGAAERISYFISCRWAMDAFGAICDLNGLNYDAPTVLYGVTQLVHAEDQFTSDTYHLFTCWVALIVLTVAAYILTYIVLNSRKVLIYHPNFLQVRKIRAFVAFATRALHRLRVLLLIVSLCVAAYLCISSDLIAIDLDIFSEFADFIGKVVESAPEHFYDIVNAFLDS